MALWQVERRTNGVVLARLVSPPMNYLNRHSLAELGVLIPQWRDPAVRVVVLAGAVPGRFITHYSCEELVKIARDPALVRAHGAAMARGFHATMRGLAQLSAPVIVAMNGDTMGGGFELSLNCDIRVGQRGDYRYGLPEVTLGMVPGGTGTQRLARLIGASNAVEFVLRGRLCTPEEALRRGLIHDLADDALAHALRLAEEIVALAPAALTGIKRVAWDGAAADLDAGLVLEAEKFAASMLAPEALQVLETYVAVPLDRRRAWLERHAALQGRG